MGNTGPAVCGIARHVSLSTMSLVYTIGDPAICNLPQPAQDVDHLAEVTDILQRGQYLLCSHLLSDAVFLVDGKRIPVHTLLLRSASCVFDRMFSDNWRNDEDVRISDFKASPFLSLLRWIYCKQIVFERGCLLDLLRLSSKYMVHSLLNVIGEVIEVRFIWSIVSHAIEYEDAVRQDACWQVIACNTKSLVNRSDFMNATPLAITIFTSFDVLSIAEVNLFEACVKWSKAECRRQKLVVTPANQRKVMNPFIQQFAFQSMTMKEFVGLPCESGLLTGDEQAIVFRFIGGKPVDTPFRKSRLVVPEGEIFRIPWASSRRPWASPPQTQYSRVRFLGGLSRARQVSVRKKYPV